MEVQSSAIDVTMENFRDLIEQSKTTLVVVLVWAEQIEPSVQTKNSLTQVAGGYSGKVVLGFVDAAENAPIAQQLGIQTIPAIRAIKDGQIVARVDGPQNDQQLREFLDPLTLSSSEALKQSIAVSIAQEDWETALSVLQEAIKEEPTNHAFRVECADVMALKGDLESAQQILATVPDDVADRNRPATRIEIAQEAAAMGDVTTAQEQLQQDSENLEYRYVTCVLLAAERRYEEALEHAMFILRADRSFREDIGRETMVRILHLLGAESPVAKAYRRKMFAFMH